MTRQIILVTGCSGGFGRLAANALAQGGHTVFAGVRELQGRNMRAAEGIRAYAQDQGLDLHAVELDVCAQASVDTAVAAIADAYGRIDVVVHAAGRGAFGPAEAFTPEQFAALYDVNVVSTQRVNRAVLPHMRQRGRGLLVWVSCSGIAGGTPPYGSPHAAAKAGLDTLAVHYAWELSRCGIETSIIVPGAFLRGAAPFSRCEKPADVDRAADYHVGPCAGLARDIEEAAGRIVPEDADPASVAGAIAWVVDTPFGKRPFRVHVDPCGDGASVALSVIDRVRDEMLNRLGLSDLLTPAIRPDPA